MLTVLATGLAVNNGTVDALAVANGRGMSLFDIWRALDVIATASVPLLTGPVCPEGRRPRLRRRVCGGLWRTPISRRVGDRVRRNGPVTPGCPKSRPRARRDRGWRRAGPPPDREVARAERDPAPNPFLRRPFWRQTQGAQRYATRSVRQKAGARRSVAPRKAHGRPSHNSSRCRLTPTSHSPIAPHSERQIGQIARSNAQSRRATTVAAHSERQINRIGSCDAQNPPAPPADRWCRTPKARGRSEFRDSLTVRSESPRFLLSIGPRRIRTEGGSNRGESGPRGGPNSPEFRSEDGHHAPHQVTQDFGDHRSRQ